MNRKIILLSIIVFTAIIILTLFLLNPNHRYNNLTINQDKWESILTSRKENVNLILNNIKFNDYNLIIDESSSSIYYSVVNDSKTKYNPNISYEVTENDVKLVILKDEITKEKINGNYEFKLMIYNKNEYHIYSLYCMDFPILNLKFEKIDDEKTKNIQVEMYLFDNLTNISNRAIKSRAKLDILENNGYKITLNKMSPGKNKRKNSISLFNMSPNNEYILVTSTSESQKGQRVELFINNKYIGLYMLDF